MGQQKRDFTQSKWYTALVCLTIFSICFGSGLVWGNLVKSPSRPPLASIPLYPGAQAVADGSGKPAGLGSPSPTPGTLKALPQGLTNFEFQTGDTPEAVLQFYERYYQNTLKKGGFYSYQEGTQTPQSINVNFFRENELGEVETMKMVATMEGEGQTKVDVTLQVQPPKNP